MSRDPTAYIHLMLLWTSCQLLVWMVGRDSLETDWWRSLALAAVGTLVPAFAVLLAVSHGTLGLVAAAVVMGLLIWGISGFLYEPEFRQRLLMAIIVPILAILSYPLAVFLRNLLIDSMIP